MRSALKVVAPSLLLLLSGCEVVLGVATAVVRDREDAPDVPTVVYESPDSIILWYEKFIGEQIHEAAQAIVQAHCGNRPINTELEELADSFTMTGTCL